MRGGAAFQSYSPPLLTRTFPLTENPISEVGIWNNGKADGLDWNNVQTTPGFAFGTAISGAATFDDNIAQLKSTYWLAPANQFAQGVISRAGGYAPTDGNFHECTLLLRFSISAHDAHGYEILWGTTNATYVDIVRWNGAVTDFTQLVHVTGVGAPANGDVFRAEIVGTVITAKINGTTVASYETASDGTKWSTGQPGMGFFLEGTAVLANMGWSSYTIGSL